MIAVAANKTIIAETAEIMIHAPWTVAAGNAREFRDVADLLDRVQRNLVKAYIRKTALGEEEIVSMLNELPDGTWLDAEKAVELGFADEINEDTTRVAAGPNLGSWLAAYKAPDEVVEKLTKQPEMSLEDAEAIIARMDAAAI